MITCIHLDKNEHFQLNIDTQGRFFLSLFDHWEDSACVEIKKPQLEQLITALQEINERINP